MTNTINHTTRRILAVATTVGAFFQTSASVLAQITNPVIGELGNDAEKAKSGALFLSFFIRMWRASITVGAIMVLAYFVWGAIDWIAAGGESGKLEKARQKMTQSAIGIIVLVSSFTIIAFISQLLFGSDFSLLNLTFPSGAASGNNVPVTPGAPGTNPIGPQPPVAN